MPSCTAIPTFAVYTATLDEYPHHFSDDGAECQRSGRNGGCDGEGGGGEGDGGGVEGDGGGGGGGDAVAATLATHEAVTPGGSTKTFVSTRYARG